MTKLHMSDGRAHCHLTLKFTPSIYALIPTLQTNYILTNQTAMHPSMPSFSISFIRQTPKILLVNRRTPLLKVPLK